MLPAGSSAPPDRFTPFGGRLCLDFANTVNGRLTISPEDLLASARDLAAWGLRMHLLTDVAASSFADAARANPGRAAIVHARALGLRENVYAVFAAIATGEHPPHRAVRHLVDTYRTVLAHSEFIPGAGSGPWWWRPTPDHDPLQLEWLVWAVIHSTVDLLTSNDLPRLKRCAGADRGCAGLFVDDTKNGIRRWCSMDGCGSRAKMRRLYARRRGGSSTL